MTKGGSSIDGGWDRTAKRAAALRENLLKRKAWQRARREPPPGESPKRPGGKKTGAPAASPGDGNSP